MSLNNENVREIGGPPHESSGAGEVKHPYKPWLIVSIAFVAVVALIGSGIWTRVRANAKLRTETSQVALTAVSVVSPQRTMPAQEIILPGNVQPFITSPIYSRTNGYLKKWN